MYQAKAFLPSDLSLNPLGAASVFWLFCTGGTLGEHALALLISPPVWGEISRSCLQRCAWSLPCLKLEFDPLWDTFCIFPLSPLPPALLHTGAQLCGWAGSGKDKTSRVLLHSPLLVPRAKPRVGWDKRRQVKWPKNCTTHCLKVE